mgnify:CR=1 FL=1
MKKSALIIFLYSIVGSHLSFAQNIFSVSNMKTNATGAILTTFDYDGTLTNNDSLPIDIEQSIISTNFPQGWACTFCNPNGCFGSAVTSDIFSVQANASSIPFTFYIHIGGNSGVGTAIVRMADANNLSDYIDYTLTATASTSTGVKEVEVTIEPLTQNYPNPFYNSTTIDYQLESNKGSFQVSNMLGQTVITKQLNTPSGQLIINNLPSEGIYFYSLYDGNKFVSRKQMIFAK